MDDDFDDRCAKVEVLNSDRFNPRDYVNCREDFTEELEKSEKVLTDIDIVQEQEQDIVISRLKKSLQNGTATKTEQERFIILDNLVYFLSNAEANPVLRLYVPGKYRTLAIEQFHEKLGHMALDKTYDSAKTKYYFPKMYQFINEYVEKCIVCQTKSAKQTRPLLQETPIPSYPFASIALDMVGPLPQTLSGNKYIVTFIDLYTGWPMAFPVPDKSAENIVHLIINEIFPVHGAPLQIVTDNGKEQMNTAVRETLDS